jgi:Ni/Co efflux regulator RcnB
MNPGTLAKFWSRVDIQGERECWLWRGEIDKSGYGRFGTRVNGAQIALAHVFSLTIATQEVANGRFAIHHCDTPACVNPLHLRWGTHEDNMRDMKTRGRSTVGEKCAAARLTEQQVRELFTRWKRGERVVALAAEYGVRHQTVSHIIKGDTWRHLNLHAARKDTP